MAKPIAVIAAGTPDNKNQLQCLLSRNLTFL